MINIICKKKRNSVKYELFFNYNKDLIDLIKLIESEKRNFNKSNKSWELTSIGLYEFIKTFKGRTDIFFDFQGEANRTIFIDTIKKEKLILTKKIERLDYVKNKQVAIKNLKKYLEENYNIVDYSSFLKEGVIPFPHQIIGAKLANEANKFIISADMGCGKTLMSILSVEMKLKEFSKVLVVVPNGLKLNWRNEIVNFTHSKWFILNGNKTVNKYSIKESKYIIVNYEYFRSSKFNINDKLIKLGVIPDEIDCLIFDEAHRLKNTKSNTTKNILKCFKKNVKNIQLLSGTIMPNRLEELYVALNLLIPEEIKNKDMFYREYCGLERDDNWGWIQAVAPDLERLYNKLEGIMYRVKKENVLKDLPEMNVSKISIEMSEKEKKEYEKIENEFKDIDWADNTKSSGSQLTVLSNLRQYTSDLKSGQVIIDLITDLNKSGEKVVIFDTFKRNLKKLSEHFKDNSRYYNGDVNIVDRQKMIDEFQDPDSGVMNLFLTQQTGKEGITLTASSYMILLSQSYVPGENEQTYARIHRIGAKKNCYIYILCVDETIDDNIYFINYQKQKIISKVIDNVNYIDTNEKSLMSEILGKYKIKYN